MNQVNADMLALTMRALKPFAEAARSFAPYSSDFDGQTVETSFTLAQLRVAQDAYAKARFFIDEECALDDQRKVKS